MVLTDNLVSYWKLEEATDAVRLDSVGSNDLSQAGQSIAQGTGKLNNGADWTGTTAARLTPGSGVLQDDTFSVSFWINMPSFNTYGHYVNHTHGNSQGWAVWLRDVGGYKIEFSGFAQPSWDWDISSSDVSMLTIGQWHHIVATRVNSGAANLYVDNVVVANTGSSGTSDYATDMTNDKFTLGSRTNTQPGNIDEAGFWNRELTVAEVAHLWSAGQGAFYDNNNADDFDDEVPICWNYTAQYKGSTKMFKLSGPGSFPTSINIPGNVDISTGKMIDDGKEIDPSNYKVE